MSSSQPRDSYRPARWRKKPVVIEAWRVPVYSEPHAEVAEVAGRSVTNYLDESIALAEWCGGIGHMMLDDDEASPAEGIDVRGPHIVIVTLEGPHAAMPGDYVIRGVAGEFYPCKPDIFAATYEAAE